ncbi:hypothetical protein CYMTET_16292, partial [Cymbomonas tetramitiformis]
VGLYQPAVSVDLGTHSSAGNMEFHLQMHAVTISSEDITSRGILSELETNQELKATWGKWKTSLCFKAVSLTLCTIHPDDQRAVTHNILKRWSMSALLTSSVPSIWSNASPGSALEVSAAAFIIQLNSNSYVATRVLLRLLQEFFEFHKYRRHRPQQPVEICPEAWWQHAGRAVLQQRSQMFWNHLAPLSKKIEDRRKRRLQYIQVYLAFKYAGSRTRRAKAAALSQLEERLPLTEIAQFRWHACVQHASRPSVWRRLRARRGSRPVDEVVALEALHEVVGSRAILSMLSRDSPHCMQLNVAFPKVSLGVIIYNPVAQEVMMYDMSLLQLECRLEKNCVSHRPAGGAVTLLVSCEALRVSSGTQDGKALSVLESPPRLFGALQEETCEGQGSPPKPYSDLRVRTRQQRPETQSEAPGTRSFLELNFYNHTAEATALGALSRLSSQDDLKLGSAMAKRKTSFFTPSDTPRSGASTPKAGGCKGYKGGGHKGRPSLYVTTAAMDVIYTHQMLVGLKSFLGTKIPVTAAPKSTLVAEILESVNLTRAAYLKQSALHGVEAPSTRLRLSPGDIRIIVPSGWSEKGAWEGGGSDPAECDPSEDSELDDEEVADDVPRAFNKGNHRCIIGEVNVRCVLARASTDAVRKLRMEAPILDTWPLRFTFKEQEKVGPEPGTHEKITDVYLKASDLHIVASSLAYRETCNILLSREEDFGWLKQHQQPGMMSTWRTAYTGRHVASDFTEKLPATPGIEEPAALKQAQESSASADAPAPSSKQPMAVRREVVLGVELPRCTITVRCYNKTGQHHDAGRESRQSPRKAAEKGVSLLELTLEELALTHMITSSEQTTRFRVGTIVLVDCSAERRTTASQDFLCRRLPLNMLRRPTKIGSLRHAFQAWHLGVMKRNHKQGRYCKSSSLLFPLDPLSQMGGHITISPDSVAILLDINFMVLLAKLECIDDIMEVVSELRMPIRPPSAAPPPAAAAPTAPPRRRRDMLVKIMLTGMHMRLEMRKVQFASISLQDVHVDLRNCISKNTNEQRISVGDLQLNNLQPGSKYVSILQTDLVGTEQSLDLLMTHLEGDEYQPPRLMVQGSLTKFKVVAVMRFFKELTDFVKVCCAEVKQGSMPAQQVASPPKPPANRSPKKKLLLSFWVHSLMVDMPRTSVSKEKYILTANVMHVVLPAASGYISKVQHQAGCKSETEQTPHSDTVRSLASAAAFKFLDKLSFGEGNGASKGRRQGSGDHQQKKTERLPADSPMFCTDTSGKPGKILVNLDALHIRWSCGSPENTEEERRVVVGPQLAVLVERPPMQIRVLTHSLNLIFGDTQFSLLMAIIMENCREPSTFRPPAPPFLPVGEPRPSFPRPPAALNIPEDDSSKWEVHVDCNDFFAIIEADDEEEALRGVRACSPCVASLKMAHLKVLVAGHASGSLRIRVACDRLLIADIRHSSNNAVYIIKPQLEEPSSSAHVPERPNRSRSATVAGTMPDRVPEVEYDMGNEWGGSACSGEPEDGSLPWEPLGLHGDLPVNAETGTCLRGKETFGLEFVIKKKKITELPCMYLEVIMSNAQLVWPYGLDLSFVWALRDIYTHYFRQPTCWANPLTNGPTRWFFLNVVLQESSIFAPSELLSQILKSQEMRRDTETSHDSGSGDSSLSSDSLGSSATFRDDTMVGTARNQRESLMAQSLANKRIELSHRQGLKLMWKWLRVGWFMGGDGERTLKVNLCRTSASLQARLEDRPSPNLHPDA